MLKEFIDIPTKFQKYEILQKYDNIKYTLLDNNINKWEEIVNNIDNIKINENVNKEVQEKYLETNIKLLYEPKLYSLFNYEIDLKNKKYKNNYDNQSIKKHNDKKHSKKDASEVTDISDYDNDSYIHNDLLDEDIFSEYDDVDNEYIDNNSIISSNSNITLNEIFTLNDEESIMSDITDITDIDVKGKIENDVNSEFSE